MPRILLAATLALLAAAPFVVAHTPDTNGNCNNVGDDTFELADVPLALETPLGFVYVTVDTVTPTVGVWTESNGLHGLQTHAHTCRTSPRADPIVVGADTPLL